MFYQFNYLHKSFTAHCILGKKSHPFLVSNYKTACLEIFSGNDQTNLITRVYQTITLTFPFDEKEPTTLPKYINLLA